MNFVQVFTEYFPRFNCSTSYLIHYFLAIDISIVLFRYNNNVTQLASYLPLPSTFIFVSSPCAAKYGDYSFLHKRPDFIEYLFETFRSMGIIYDYIKFL